MRRKALEALLRRSNHGNRGQQNGSSASRHGYSVSSPLRGTVFYQGARQKCFSSAFVLSVRRVQVSRSRIFRANVRGRLFLFTHRRVVCFRFFKFLGLAHWMSSVRFFRIPRGVFMMVERGGVYRSVTCTFYVHGVISYHRCFLFRPSGRSPFTTTRTLMRFRCRRTRSRRCSYSRGRISRSSQPQRHRPAPNGDRHRSSR